MSLGIDPLIVDIPNFPNYQISEEGVVYNKITGKEIKQSLNSSGYYGVHLSKNNVRSYVSVHRLLALAFIHNPNNKEFVDHIDRNKLNNKLENLRWVTNSENQTNTNVPINNKSGVIGVSHGLQKGKYPYWFSRIIKDGKEYKKLFPYTDEGLENACNWREIMEGKLHKIL